MNIVSYYENKDSDCITVVNDVGTSVSEVCDVDSSDSVFELKSLRLSNDDSGIFNLMGGNV